MKFISHFTIFDYLQTYDFFWNEASMIALNKYQMEDDVFSQTHFCPKPLL